MDSNYSQKLRRATAAAERAVPWVAVAVAPLAVVAVVRTQRDAIRELNGAVDPSALALAAAAFAAAPLLQAASYWFALRLLTGSAPLLDTLVVWARSYILRYAPTGTIAIAYRLAGRHRSNASADQVLAAYAYEHVCTLAAGALACLFLFCLAGQAPPILPLLVAVAALLATAALQPGLAGRLVAAAARRFGLHVAPVLGRRQLVALVAVTSLGWLGTGAAVYVVVRTVTGETGNATWIVASYAAAYLVGFVAPLAPGGIGVREGALVLFLGPRYGVAAALAVSLATRVANVMGELIAVAAIHGAAVVRGAARRWAHQPVGLGAR